LLLKNVFAVRKGGKLNADYYMSETLTPLAEWLAGQLGATNRQLIVRSDNARPDTAEKVNEFSAGQRMTRGSHPPYLPGLEPENQLIGRSFDDTDQLLMVIKEVFESVEKALLGKVFHEWGERLAKCLVGRSGLGENT
jgi:hypothetical protein